MGIFDRDKTARQQHDAVHNYALVAMRNERRVQLRERHMRIEVARSGFEYALAARGAWFSFTAKQLAEFAYELGKVRTYFSTLTGDEILSSSVNDEIIEFTDKHRDMLAHFSKRCGG